MIATDECPPTLTRRVRGKRRYVMIFRANSAGLAKRVELWASCSNEVFR